MLDEEYTVGRTGHGMVVGVNNITVCSKVHLSVGRPFHRQYGNGLVRLLGDSWGDFFARDSNLQARESITRTSASLKWMRKVVPAYCLCLLDCGHETMHASALR